MPEWGCNGPLNGGPSWSKRSRNTKGFRISPKSDGLIKRVIGPCVRPRVRRRIARVRRGGRDLASATDIVAPSKVAWELALSLQTAGSGSPRTGHVQSRGPPQQIVDH